MRPAKRRKRTKKEQRERYLKCLVELTAPPVIDPDTSASECQLGYEAFCEIIGMTPASFDPEETKRMVLDPEARQRMVLGLAARGLRVPASPAIFDQDDLSSSVPVTERIAAPKET
jgi:hypothetical protein